MALLDWDLTVWPLSALSITSAGASILLVAPLVLVLVTLYFYAKPFSIDKSLPGPIRHWLWGTVFEFEGDNHEPFTWDKWPTLALNVSRRFLYKTWGSPTLNIGFGGAFFYICSPENLQYVLRDNFDNYVKGKVARGCLEELFGQGVFTADGELWKFHRKVTVSFMTRDLLKHACLVMHSKLEQVSSILDSVETETSIDFQDLCMRLTLDVMVNVAFGVEMDTLKDPDLAFNQAFTAIQLHCHERFNDLFWEFRKRFKWGERERTIRECAAVLDDFAFGVIERGKRNATDQQDTTSSSDRPDLVSRYLRHVARTRKKDDPEPNPRELRDLVMNFALAGRDGTACTMSWALYELTKHPAVADSVRQEVKQVCRGEDYSFEAIQKLTYTHAVVMETLRLHPPVPDDFKFALRDDTLPDGTRVPAGSLMMYSPYTINHSEPVWGSDASEFKPERFLNSSEPSPFKFPSFNAGPRTCPGKPLALLEVKLALAFLLERFDFQDANGHDGSYKWNLVMAMENGFHVKVKTRQ